MSTSPLPDSQKYFLSDLCRLLLDFEHWKTQKIDAIRIYDLPDGPGLTFDLEYTSGKRPKRGEITSVDITIEKPGLGISTLTKAQHDRKENMKIEGFDEDQIARLAEKWNLGQPIDVRGFLDRTDIPAEIKERIKQAGKIEGGNASNVQQATAYRKMQAQILREVARLDKRRWQPDAPNS
jgi:hypothetical protein